MRNFCFLITTFFRHRESSLLINLASTVPAAYTIAENERFHVEMTNSNIRTSFLLVEEINPNGIFDVCVSSYTQTTQRPCHHASVLCWRLMLVPRTRIEGGA